MKVLIDHLNIVFISFSMTKRELKEKGIDDFTEEHFGLFYHTLFNKYNLLFKTYGQLIICHEGYKSLDWRRSVYADYKRNRDAGKTDPSYLAFKKTLSVIEDVLNYYPCKQIKVEGAEGDDVIYKLARYYAEEEGEDVLILSGDGDLAQIKKYSDKISLYHPIRKKMVELKENLLEYKAIVGDKSDNIPGLYRVGDKTFEKMMLDKKLYNEKMKGDNFESFQKFLKIVDLSQVPNDIQENILKTNKELEFNKFKPGNIEKFYYDNDMKDHLRRWTKDTDEINESCGTEYDYSASSVKIKKSKKDEFDDFLSDYV